MFFCFVVFVFVIGVVCVGVVVGYGVVFGGCVCDCECVDVCVCDVVYDCEVKIFDDVVRFSEYWFGIENMCVLFVYGVCGDVLEVVCGMGRNFLYYDLKKVCMLLVMDVCDGMVEEVRVKLWMRDGGTTVREVIVMWGDV